MTSCSEGEVGRTLVTGGLGFIGRRVVRQLLSTGAEVVIASKDPGPVDEAREIMVADLRNPVDAKRAVVGCENIVHLAATQGGIQFQQAAPERVFLDNVTVTHNVLEAALAAGVRRVVMASSAVVYSRDAGSPIREDAPLVDPRSEPVSPYAWSKVTDEVAAMWFGQRGLDVVRVRFANVYGPGASLAPEHSTVVHSLVRKAIEAGPGDRIQVWGDGRALRSFVHVDDAGRAVVAVLCRGEAGAVYNVSSTGAVAIGDLARLVRDVGAPDAVLSFDDTAPAGPLSRVLDHTALSDLGFDGVVDLPAGIGSVVADTRSRLLGGD